MTSTTRRGRRYSRRQRSHAERFRAAAQGIKVELGEAQFLVHQHQARTRVLVAGRRFGKTFLACLELILFALLHGNSLCWYVGPTKGQAEEIAWDTLKDVLRLLPAKLVSSISETKLRIRFRNGSVVQLKSAHKPDGLRGRALDFVVVDECALIDKEVWEMILQPALGDREGRALLISTPKGFNWFYDVFNEGAGQRANPSAELASWQFTTLDGGRLTPEEIARLKAKMTPRGFRQEMLASFEAMGGRVYDLFDRTKHLSKPIVDRGGALYVGFDFNVNPMTAIVGQRGDLDEELEVLASIQIETSNTRELGEAVIQRFGGRNVSGKPTRLVIAHPDPAGKNRDTRSGTTDHLILEELGYHVDASSAHPPIVDRVNAVGVLLSDANDRVRLWLHPTDCVSLVRTMEGQVWDKKGFRRPEKGKDGLDHAGDALGYLVWQSFNRLESPSGVVGVSW